MDLASFVRSIGAACVAAAGLMPAQSSLVNWGVFGYDTDAYSLPATKVVARGRLTGLIRVDGRVFVHGNGGVSDAPVNHATPCVDVAVGGGETSSGAVALFADGTVTHWAWHPLAAAAPVPPVPPGVRYTDVFAMSLVFGAVRSDGLIVTWGEQGTMAVNLLDQPPLPPVGSQFVAAVAGARHVLALTDHGEVVAFGRNDDGQCNVPSLPAGMAYVKVAAGRWFSLALRSDGEVVAWGQNDRGQCNIPPLPPGLQYIDMSGGYYHAKLLRSDGEIVHVGWNPNGIHTPPPIPAGTTVTQIASGTEHDVALLSDGQVLAWGSDNYLYPMHLPRLPAGERWTQFGVGYGHTVALRSDGQLIAFGDDSVGQLGVPPLPPGMRYSQISVGSGHSAAIRSDGNIVAWGWNPHGQLNVPPLPPGMRYERVVAANVATVAIRSDGRALGWGLDGVYSSLNIPAPPTGVRYIDIDAAHMRTALLRSDGQVVSLGDQPHPIYAVPPLPTGLRYVEVATADMFTAARRSDGQVVTWGSPLHHILPPLPAGVYYVEIDCSLSELMALRSDGLVVTATADPVSPPPVPELCPGTSYVEVSGLSGQLAARVGPTSTYISFQPGCPGSGPATRLIPLDTPRIGAVFEANVLGLPQDAAVMVFGFQRTAPQPLAAYGMPGCSLHTSPDGAYFVFGSQGSAPYRLPIPNDPQLVGLRFYNQAIVFDAQAPNPLRAVVSDAAEGVVGHW